MLVHIKVLGYMGQALYSVHLQIFGYIPVGQVLYNVHLKVHGYVGYVVLYNLKVHGYVGQVMCSVQVYILRLNRYVGQVLYYVHLKVHGNVEQVHLKVHGHVHCTSCTS